MRRIVGCLCVLIVLALAAGCAAPGTKPSSPATEKAGPLEWGTFAANVTGVRPGPDDRTVVVEIAAPAGAEGCSRNTRVENLTEENGRIFASVVEESAMAQVRGGCPTTVPAEVPLSSKDPIGERPLVLNQKAWSLRGGSYQQCDEDLGCTPPQDPCDQVWVRAAVQGLDVSRHSVGDVESCDGTWLVMTVPDDPAACGAEARPGCTVDTANRRYFLKFAKGKGWSVLTRTSGAGCGAVLEADEHFPRKLCKDLTAPGRLVSVAPALSASPAGG